jgi:hypothetical protein
MSDTPRTDAYNWDNGNYDDPLHAWFDFARQLERELNAANERIKRLEEAGNNLLWNFCPEYTSDLTQEQSDALKQWNKAKEDKP